MCLGGGGWLQFRAKYKPLRNELSTFLSIGIAAKACFDISLGPISGAVSMSLGIGCEFSNSGRGSSKLAFIVIFTIKGEVDLSGIVSAYVSLSLSLSYERAGGKTLLIGRGQLEIEIEICWCFTLSIDESVEYTFIGSSDKSHGAMNNEIDTHAKTYVDSVA